jgi:hypothetical protein
LARCFPTASKQILPFFLISGFPAHCLTSQPFVRFLIGNRFRVHLYGISATAVPVELAELLDKSDEKFANIAIPTQSIRSPAKKPIQRIAIQFTAPIRRGINASQRFFSLIETQGARLASRKRMENRPQAKKQVYGTVIDQCARHSPNWIACSKPAQAAP